MQCKDKFLVQSVIVDQPLSVTRLPPPLLTATSRPSLSLQRPSPPPKLLTGFESELPMSQHHLRGVVRILDGCSFPIRDFDMLSDSPEVRWWGASGESFAYLTALLESQVQDNQNILCTFDTVINRLQAEIDRKDSAAAAVLKQTLITLNAANVSLRFNGVLKDSRHAAHRFTRVLIDMMMSSSWNLGSAAEAIHPGVAYAKPGHCRCEEGERTRANSLRQFIEH